MDNQPMGQMPEQPAEQSREPMMAPAARQQSSCLVWCSIGIVVVLVALGLWYFYGTKPAAEQATDVPASALEETRLADPSVGNTTADISADLDQLSDGAAALDADAAATAEAVSAL